MNESANSLSLLSDGSGRHESTSKATADERDEKDQHEREKKRKWLVFIPVQSSTSGNSSSSIQVFKFSESSPTSAFHKYSCCLLAGRLVCAGKSVKNFPSTIKTSSRKIIIYDKRLQPWESERVREEWNVECGGWEFCMNFRRSFHFIKYFA